MVIGRGPQGYYNFLEVVFMKDDVWNFLDWIEIHSQQANLLLFWILRIISFSYQTKNNHQYLDIEIFYLIIFISCKLFLSLCTPLLSVCPRWTHRGVVEPLPYHPHHSSLSANLFPVHWLQVPGVPRVPGETGGHSLLVNRVDIEGKVVLEVAHLA